MGYKKWSRSTICICVCIFMICSFSACAIMQDADNETTIETSGGDETVELTQRQIQVLEEVGLPTDYAKLNDSQRHDIMAIEDMLCYLEDTYKLKATYKSFLQGSPVNDETLIAELGLYTITVSRHYENGRYVYTDNYAAVDSKEMYEDQLKAFFAEKSLEVKLYAEIDSVESGTDDLISGTIASVYVFVCADMSRTELEALVAEYAAWMIPQLNGTANATRFYLVDQNAYLDIGSATYSACLQEVSADNRVICIISADGSVVTR